MGFTRRVIGLDVSDDKIVEFWIKLEEMKAVGDSMCRFMGMTPKKLCEWQIEMEKRKARSWIWQI